MFTFVLSPSLCASLSRWSSSGREHRRIMLFTRTFSIFDNDRPAAKAAIESANGIGREIVSRRDRHPRFPRLPRGGDAVAHACCISTVKNYSGGCRRSTRKRRGSSRGCEVTSERFSPELARERAEKLNARGTRGKTLRRLRRNVRPAIRAAKFYGAFYMAPSSLSRFFDEDRRRYEPPRVRLPFHRANTSLERNENRVLAIS